MKNRILKKMLAAVLAAAMLVTNLTACGNKNDTPDPGSSTGGGSTAQDSSGSPDAEKEGEEEEPEAPVEIQKVTIWSGDAHSKNVMLELIDNFNQNQGKELGVEIEYSVRTDITADIDAAVASQQEPDMYKSWSAAKLYETGEIIAFEDIEGGAEYLASYPDDAISLVKDKTTGKTHFVPYYVNTFGIAINKDMFIKRGLADEAGEVKIPKTYAELREFAQILTNEADGEFGMAFPIAMTSFWQIFPRMAFSSRGTNGYDVRAGVWNHEELETVFQLAIDIKNDGSIYPGADGLDNDAARALFAEGKIGMIFTGSYDTATFTTQFPAKCDWMVIPYPTETENPPYKQLSSSNDGLVMNVEMVERLGAEKALEVYKWYHGTEVLTALYRTGCCIPWDSSIIANTTVDADVHPTWSQYAAINEFSIPTYSNIPTDLEGTPSLATVFSTNIWAEDGKLSDLLADVAKRYNDGTEKRFAANPDLVRDRYINADLDINR